jgi:hypothetical protein
MRLEVNVSDSNLRKNLIELLSGGEAHVSVEKVLQAIKPESRNIRPEGMQHSAWEIFEHMRLAQEDIVRYTLDPNWVSPPFPQGYWNPSPETMTEGDWDHSLARFVADLKEMMEMVKNPGIALTAEIPHGEGRTYLREVLLIADHNAYHLGQIVQILKSLGSWQR